MLITVRRSEKKSTLLQSIELDDAGSYGYLLHDREDPRDNAAAGNHTLPATAVRSRGVTSESTEPIRATQLDARLQKRQAQSWRMKQQCQMGVFGPRMSRTRAPEGFGRSPKGQRAGMRAAVTRDRKSRRDGAGPKARGAPRCLATFGVAFSLVTFLLAKTKESHLPWVSHPQDGFESSPAGRSIPHVHAFQSHPLFPPIPAVRAGNGTRKSAQ
jgi:hypothetical protein